MLTFKCERHDSVYALQQMPFEILLEMGAMALLDGYYREAVGSFAVALERFIEFYLRAVCTGRGIDQKELVDAWKDVAASSQQQVGAFVFLHLLEAGAAPDIPRWSADFRNDVIHKGLLPSRANTLKYCKWAFDFIRDIGTDLRSRHSTAADRVVVQSLIERGRPYREAGKNVGTHFIVMFLTWAGGDWSKRSFDHELKELEARRWAMWAPPGPTG